MARRSHIYALEEIAINRRIAINLLYFAKPRLSYHSFSFRLGLGKNILQIDGFSRSVVRPGNLHFKKLGPLILLRYILLFVHYLLKS